jgi:hypothetical protein
MITELLNLPASSAHKGGDLSSSPGHGRVGYRPDIDGLRAVAVLAVIAFHFQTATGPFGGGFVGVDIFFVISGYLISSVIFAEVAASQFSIVAFYERRIRRIFPALFVMLAGVSILSYFYLLPNELMDYATSLVASTLSVSNFYFWRHPASHLVAGCRRAILHFIPSFSGVGSSVCSQTASSNRRGAGGLVARAERCGCVSVSHRSLLYAVHQSMGALTWHHAIP